MEKAFLFDVVSKIYVATDRHVFLAEAVCFKTIHVLPLVPDFSFEKRGSWSFAECLKEIQVLADDHITR